MGSQIIIQVMNVFLSPKKNAHFITLFFVGLAYQCKKDIVFRFIIEYSSLRDFGY
jgi:phosphotransferase system  glucose/maltose/N-acetylglucosamine-specific IIC component